MGRLMGFDYGLEAEDLCMTKKDRWLFKISNISAEGVKSLPPSKSSRPMLSFKEMELEHVTETIYFPQKPEWKPITLTLYEPASRAKNHPVFLWIKRLYSVEKVDVKWNPALGTRSAPGIKLPEATLEMYDGCGEVIQKWVFNGVWPQSIEFGDLDMADSSITTVDLTLRYDRAYIVEL